jgi:hypothetical protein
VLNLGSEGIRYFAGSVSRMRTTDLRRRADEDMHVHLVAFIAHQYFRLHDNLVDVLLISVKTIENAALREDRDWCFDERKRHEQAAESLLDDLDASVFRIFRQIREAVDDDLLSDKEKVARIGLLVRPEQTVEEKSRELRASLVNGAADDHYFDILESRSVRLQNQVGGILKAITFQAAPHIADLEAAIARFVARMASLIARRQPRFSPGMSERRSGKTASSAFRSTRFFCFDMWRAPSNREV